MNKLKIALIISLIVNALAGLYVVGGFIISASLTDIGLYNGVHNKLCVEDYDKILAKYDIDYADDPKRAADSKNSFAINVCLRNYKTGEKLDVQPLVDQVK